ncbi:hypothetical protein Tco_1316578 [Tanacetum coccineum]
MGPRINKIFGMSRVTSKGSAPELVKRETDTRVTCTVDAFKHSETLCAITMRYMEIGKSYRIDEEVFQDQRQRDDNDLQDERQYQPKEEEVEPRRSKRVRIEKSFGPDFVSFLVENEPTSYQEGNNPRKGSMETAIKSEIDSNLQTSYLVAVRVDIHSGVKSTRAINYLQEAR